MSWKGDKHAKYDTDLIAPEIGYSAQHSEIDNINAAESKTGFVQLHDGLRQASRFVRCSIVMTPKRI
jgi:hypothetical protein